MAKLKFNGVAISNARGFATTAKATTGSVADGVAAIQRGIQGEVAARSNIAYRLSSIQWNIDQIENKMQAIYQTVDNAAMQYDAAERQIIGLAQQVSYGNIAKRNSSNYEKFANIKNIPNKKVEVSDNKTGIKWGVVVEKGGSLFMTLVGKVGFLGGMTKVGADFISAVKNNSKIKMGTALVAGGKSFVTLVGDLAANAYKKPQEQDWKKAFIGDWSTYTLLKNLKKSSTVLDKVKTAGGKWWAAFKKETASYFPNSAQNVGDKIKVGTKWAGVALSALSNGIENYDECKSGEIGVGRAIGETIGETVADVGIGIVATASVVGGAALLGISAPAVVVGAAAAGATWIADEIIKATTGKDGLSELISDAVLDTGEMIGGAIKSGVQGVGKAIGKIGAKWKACFG